MTDAALVAAKNAARAAGFARRAGAHASRRDGDAAHLLRVLHDHAGAPVAGYAAMRTEIDPAAALEAASRQGPVALPVIVASGQPLRFRRWHPGRAMERGTFGAMIPAAGDWVVPQVLVVPLVAFTRTGGRLGYGGGFYDRTLAALRAERPTLAIGFAYAAQQAPDLPLEGTDEPLDLIVTETGVIVP